MPPKSGLYSTPLIFLLAAILNYCVSLSFKLRSLTRPLRLAGFSSSSSMTKDADSSGELLKLLLYFNVYVDYIMQLFLFILL